MISEFPLFIFTIVGGLAAGAYATAAVFPPFKDNAARSWIAPVVCLALLFVGGIALLLHLGHPERVFNAFANPSAGITQEGFTCIAFGVLLVLDLIIALATKKPSPRIVRVLGGIAGIALLLVMGLAYASFYGVPAWNSWTTVPLFVLGGLACGSTLIAACGVNEAIRSNALMAAAVIDLLFALMCVAVGMGFAE